jgi:hypothetical protein
VCFDFKIKDIFIVVTIQAYDPHNSGVSVAARGKSGLSDPEAGLTNTLLSKIYNGNLADQGFAVPIEFFSDPWSDPQVMLLCFYVAYVEINDSAILYDHYDGE